jgi:phenylacetate-CoA ligase
VELSAGRGPDPALAGTLAAAVRDELRRINSEFAHYVPADRQLPVVELRVRGDAEYFPVGVKHRYTRAPGS